MLLGLGLASTSIVAAVPIPVNLVDGDWQNAVPAGVTIVNSGAGGGLSTARWGIPFPPNTNQSGYDFLSATTPFNALSDGTPFALGTFTHHNFPITGTSLTSIDLLVNLGIGSPTVFSAATFDFTHNETPNNASPDSNPLNNDLVTLTNPFLNVNFSYLGNNYFFNLMGFSQNGGATISTAFSTVEGQPNTATLYGEITERAISTPEPATLLFLGLGLIGVAGLRRRLTK